MIRSTGSRRFRPSLDSLPSRITPSDSGFSPMDPVAVSTGLPPDNPPADTSPMDPVMVSTGLDSNDNNTTH